MDGSDPRELDSGSDPIKAYKKPITIDEPVTVKARTLAKDRWSALTEATFFPDHIGHPVRITELMYKPSGGAEYEFVELLNTSNVRADLGWFSFKGINFTFGMSDSIGPNERIVLGWPIGASQ